jgi:membrane-associated phospholipid phosphatase
MLSGSLVLALSIGSFSAASAQEQTQTGPQPPRPPVVPSTSSHDDGRRTMGRLPANLGRGLVGMFNLDNLTPALIGSVATSTSSFFDADAREAAVGQLGWSDTFETAGGPLYSTLFVAGMFTAGRFTSGTRFRAMTYDMLDAAVVNFTYNSVLKVAVGRERPNGQDNKSFPSGHTSNAFALATVAQRHYGWKIGIPSYGLAGLMGISRIHQDKHWLSDVVAGATLGYISGRTVTRVNSQSEHATRASWNLSPVLTRHSRGAEMSVTF